MDVGYQDKERRGGRRPRNDHPPIPRASDGSYLVEGKRVSGFTNMEEKLNRTAKAMPFSPEDEIGKRGGRFTKRPPFSTFAVADGRLTSGQNPMSAAKTATLLVETLQA